MENTARQLLLLSNAGAQMAESNSGKIGWVDFAVQNAGEVRDFYSAVVGWESQPATMGDYEDYCMHLPGDEAPVTGICHAKGVNANLPPQWMIYVTVGDLASSLLLVIDKGGKVLEQRGEGQGALAIIQDPGGAIAALYQE
ncbi:MAG: putative enzyme related to lactoylglutathione lyase [Pirellulaceae bacterium]|jgi:predicted enzyme related to lactoylglutathione lyase